MGRRVALIRFFASPIGRRVGLVAVVLLFLIGLVLDARRDGAEAERERVRVEREEAINRARERRDEAREASDDVLRCGLLGGCP